MSRSKRASNAPSPDFSLIGMVATGRTSTNRRLPDRWSSDEDELLYAEGRVIRRFPRDVDDLVSLARGMVTRNLTHDECVRHLGAERCVS